MDEKQYWSMDELLSLTETVQEAEVEFGEKFLKIQWCELTEAEEPKMNLPDDEAGEEEKNKAYQKIGVAKVLAMIEKANEMNPEGKTLDSDAWEHLPSTLRYNLSAVVLGGDTKSDF